MGEFEEIQLICDINTPNDAAGPTFQLWQLMLFERDQSVERWHVGPIYISIIIDSIDQPLAFNAKVKRVKSSTISDTNKCLFRSNYTHRTITANKNYQGVVYLVNENKKINQSIKDEQIFIKIEYD